MASSGLKKVLDLIILYTLKSVSENVYLILICLLYNTKDILAIPSAITTTNEVKYIVVLTSATTKRQ